jgi:hypothetical protein
MEHLEGESLSALLKRNGPIDLPAACAILEPVLTALSAAPTTETTKKPNQKLRQGGRGTKFTETFDD